jgi:hypothetical protein
MSDKRRKIALAVLVIAGPWCIGALAIAVMQPQISDAVAEMLDDIILGYKASLSLPERHYGIE